MVTLKLWFGMALIVVAAIWIYPPYKLARWGAAIVRRQRNLLEPATQESFDEFVKTVLGGIRS